MMKTNYFFKLMLTLLFLPVTVLSQVDVTIKVDMSGETVSPDGVHIAGTINGWNTSSTQLTQEGSTDIYSATVQLSEGWHRYKFLNGNAWGTEESAGYPCATSGGDRFLYVNDSGMAVTLEPVPFGDCNAEGTGFSFTLNVDMSSEASISPSGVHVAGWFNDWSPNTFALPDVDGDVYSATLRLPTPSDYPIEFEYKYLNGNEWGTEETPGPESSCSTVNVDDNRIVTLNNSGENAFDLFNGCNYTLNIENFNETNLKLVYNKNSRSLEFYSDNSKDDISLIQVYNLAGKKLKSKTVDNSIQNTSINFRGSENGLYILRFQNADSSFAKKVYVY